MMATEVLNEGCSSFDLVRALGTSLSYRQLDYWCRLGVLVPAEGANGGSGVGRRFDRQECEIVSVCAALARVRCPTTVLRVVAAQLRAADVVFDRPTLYVTADGAITDAAETGWSVSLTECEFMVGAVTSGRPMNRDIERVITGRGQRAELRRALRPADRIEAGRIRAYDPDEMTGSDVEE
jgi:hypothetical protein